MSAVVCGMGGSSLAPDILADTFGPIAGYPQLYVLDSTSPQQIKELEEQDRRSHVRSSSFRARAARRPSPTPSTPTSTKRSRSRSGPPPAARNFVAITDPGTKLDKEAQEESFRADFENDPNIGGRYSALSFVGIAPSAIAGLRHQPAARPRARRDARQRPHRRSAQRTGRALRRGDRRSRRERPRQADDRHAPRGQGLRRVGRTARRRIDRETRQAASCRSRASRSASPSDYSDDRIFAYVGANLPDPDPGVDEKLRALEAAGHPVIRLDMNDALRRRRAVLPLGDRRRRSRRHPRNQRVRSAQRSGVERQHGRAARAVRAQRQVRRAQARRRGRRLRRYLPLRQQHRFRRRTRCRRWPDSSRSCGRTTTTRSPRTSRATTTHARAARGTSPENSQRRIASRRRSASARASYTRPDSCTRAAPTRASCCRSPPTIPTIR